MAFANEPTLPRTAGTNWTTEYTDERGIVQTHHFLNVNEARNFADAEAKRTSVPCEVIEHQVIYVTPGYEEWMNDAGEIERSH